MQRKFSTDENKAWKEVLSTQRPRRSRQLHPLFQQGLDVLGMDLDVIPDIDEVNRKLKSRTGWVGKLVKGLEDGPSFYAMLAQREFPLGDFVRDAKDLNYTPEPDIIHDFYGHIPFFADPAYADFNQKYGETAMKYVQDSERFRQFERFYWFTLEFGLIETGAGRRIFGAGIASSIGECEYALGKSPTGAPEVLPFGIEQVRQQEFRIDEMQKRLFVIQDLPQLYSSLPTLEKAIIRG